MMGIRKVGRAFKKVGRGLKAAGKAIVNAFAKVFVALFGLEGLLQFQSAARLLLASDFGKVVMAIITELSRENLSNEEKRRQAFERIVQAAVAAGLDYKDSIINLLIEIAVQRLKGLVPK